MSTEYGKLVVLKKDGSLGPSFSISSDISIGRDKTCEIRIKLDCVSRLHSTITIDENGHCSLTHLSKTNPTLVNGNPLNDSMILSSGDKINIGEREFIYEIAGLGSNDNTMKLPTTVIADTKQAISKLALKSPLRNAINARRFSVEPVVAQPAPAVVVVAASPKQPESNQPSKMKTPLRNAIESRRQNLRPVGSTHASSTNQKEASSRPMLKTPLRNAIQARLRKYESTAAAMEVEKQSSSSTTNEKAVITTLAPVLRVGTRTPLRNAINARRKSVGVEIEPVQLMNVTAAESSSPAVVSDISSQQFMVTVEQGVGRLTPIAPKMLKTPIRAMINARRQSYEKNRRSTDSHLRCLASSPRREYNSLKTPLRRAIEAKRKSITSSDVEIQQDTAVACLSSILSSPVPDITAAVIEAACTELAIEACLQEIQFHEALSPADARTKAMISFQESPGKFRSPMRMSDVGTAANKQVENVEDAVMTSNDEDHQHQADLIQELADVEMELIEIYAEKIEYFTEELSQEQAYELAMAAYVRGIEAYHEDNTSPEVDAEKSSTIIPRRDFELDFAYGKSIREMFKLPLEYMTAYNDDRDMELVEMYAEEIADCSDVDDEVAYSIALDTFISDPVAFRHRIGGLAIYNTPDDEAEVVADNTIVEVDGDVELTVVEENAPVSDDILVASNPVKMSAAKEPASTARRSSLRVQKCASEVEDSMDADNIPSTTARTPRSTRKIDMPEPVSTARRSTRLSMTATVVEPMEVETSSTRTPRSTRKVESSATPAKTPATTPVVAPKSTKKSTSKSVKPQDDKEKTVESEVVTMIPSISEDIVTKAADMLTIVNEVQVVDAQIVQVEPVVVTKPKSKRSREVVQDVEVVKPDITSPVSKRSRASSSKSSAMEEESVPVASTPAPAVGDASDTGLVSDKKPKSTTRGRKAATPASSAVASGTTPVPVIAAPSPATVDTKKTNCRKRKVAEVEVVEEVEEEVEDATVLLCDGCDGEFFMEEVGLASIPEGDWFCTTCVDNKSDSKQATKKGKASKVAKVEKAEGDAPVSKRSKVSKAEAVVEAPVAEPVLEARRSTRKK